jgi:CRP-like cAMP-binding protein
MPAFAFLRNEPDVRTFKAGEVTFAEGDAGDSMFAVLEGEVEIRSATAVVTRDCRVAAVGQRRFTVLVRQTPYFALEIMQILADRLRRNTSS